MGNCELVSRSCSLPPSKTSAGGRKPKFIGASPPPLPLSLPAPLPFWSPAETSSDAAPLISSALISRSVPPPPPSPPRLCVDLHSVTFQRHLGYHTHSLPSHSSCIRAGTLRTNWPTFKRHSFSAVKSIAATVSRFNTGRSDLQQARPKYSSCPTLDHTDTLVCEACWHQARCLESHCSNDPARNTLTKFIPKTLLSEPKKLSPDAAREILTFLVSELTAVKKIKEN